MNAEGDGFCMELARILSIRDVRRILRYSSEVQLPGDLSSSKPIESDVSDEDGTASESFNNSQFTRLPRDFEMSLSEANGSLLIQCLNKLRDCASQPEEFYTSLSKEQWLRTVVNCESKGALLLFSRDFSENDSSHFTIQSTVVPCKPYWEKLQRARSSKDDKAGVSSKGAYFPSTSLQGNHVFQSSTRDYQQEYNILRGWVERFDNDMIDPTDMITRRLRREIKPSDGDLRLNALSILLRENSGRFREEIWRGGLFGVKVFKKEDNKTFLREVKVLEAIGTHPHIVHCFGVSKPEETDGYKYWMEKLDRDLYDFIIELSRSREDASEDSPNNSPQDSPKDSPRHSRKNLPFSVIDSMEILLQIAKAMTRLHELEVIHGDLKADNILVSHYEVLGDVKLYIVKVADFDSAIIIMSDDEVVHITGTDEYIAPEVWRGRGTRASSSTEELSIPGTPLSSSNAKKCDVYSFGIVAVEVLSGQISDGKQKDFDHDRRDDIMAPLEAIRSYHIYPDLIDLVYRCLNHDSSLRLPFAEVTTELEYIIDDVFE